MDPETLVRRRARRRPRRPLRLDRRRRHGHQAPRRHHAHVAARHRQRARGRARDVAARCKRFVDFSTSEVFGRFAYHVTEFDVTTLGAVGEARWTYAVAKLATEHLAHDLPPPARPSRRCRSARSTSTARARWARARCTTSSCARSRASRCTVHNDGSQIRAWCYVDDIVDAVLALPRRPEARRPRLQHRQPALDGDHLQPGASGSSAFAGCPREIVFRPLDHPDVELRVPSVSKARELLGFEAKVDLDEGLLRTISWYRERQPATT